MIELSRTVRFCLDPTAPRPARANGFSAWPPMRGLGRFYQARIRCRGEADPETGYFLNIKHLDQAFRDHGIPLLEARLAEAADPGAVPLGTLMGELYDRLQAPLGGTVDRLALDLSPFCSLALEETRMGEIEIRQHYEFSAAHRLHAPNLSEEENRRLFGKCNNPSGHGHNYRLEVAVAAPIDEHGHVLDIADLDEAVDRAVIEPLDHKHLNLDVPAFDGRNPSVEHIAETVYGMLEPAIAPLGARLEEVSVWETEKTVCTYRGARRGTRASPSA